MIAKTTARWFALAELVGGDVLGGPADGELTSVDRPAELDELVEHLWRHPVSATRPKRL